MIRYIPDKNRRTYHRTTRSNKSLSLSTPVSSPIQVKEPETKESFEQEYLEYEEHELFTEMDSVEEDKERESPGEGVYSEPVERSEPEPISLTSISPKSESVHVPAYTPPKPEIIKETINRFYAQFPQGKDNFIQSFLQSKHGFTLEEARKALEQYREGNLSPAHACHCCAA